MILIDDILLFPGRGLLWVFREIANAAQRELADEAQNITAELSELYRRLDTAQITEAAFDIQEGELLDRLSAVLNAALAEREADPGGSPPHSPVSPDSHREQIQQGLALVAAGEHEAARAVYDQIIQKDPKCTEAHYRRAMIFLQQEDYDASLRDSQETLRCDPSHFGALVLAGKCYHEQFIRIDPRRRRSFRRMEAYWELAFDAYNRALSLLSQRSPTSDPQ